MKQIIKTDIIILSKEQYAFLTSIDTKIFANLSNNLLANTNNAETEVIGSLELKDRSGARLINSDVSFEEIFKPVMENAYRPKRLLFTCESNAQRNYFSSKMAKMLAQDDNGFSVDFAFSFVIRLKDVTESIEKVIHKQYNAAAGKDVVFSRLLGLLDRIGSHVLVLLDGYDELSEKGHESLLKIVSFNRRVGVKAYLRNATIVLTSAKAVPPAVSQFFEKFFYTTDKQSPCSLSPSQHG